MTAGGTIIFIQNFVWRSRMLVFIDKDTVESSTVYLDRQYLPEVRLRFNRSGPPRLGARSYFTAFKWRPVSLPQYMARHWWMEATADYVADKIAWNGLGTMSSGAWCIFSDPFTTLMQSMSTIRRDSLIISYRRRNQIQRFGLPVLRTYGTNQSRIPLMIMVQFLEDYVLKRRPPPCTTLTGNSPHISFLMVPALWKEAVQAIRLVRLSNTKHRCT